MRGSIDLQSHDNIFKKYNPLKNLRCFIIFSLSRFFFLQCSFTIIYKGLLKISGAWKNFINTDKICKKINYYNKILIVLRGVYFQKNIFIFIVEIPNKKINNFFLANFFFFNF